MSGGWKYPPAGAKTTPTYAVLQDLSGVVETTDGFGIFATKVEALEALILRLESDRTEVVNSIAAAKRARRAEIKRKAHV